MENIALIESFSEFKGDKNIDRVTLMAILEEVFRAALKRKFGSDDNFDIIINPDKGDLEIWRNRVVVADGMSEDDNEEIELAEARKIEPDFEIGEDVSEEVKLIDLGRRAILALRQNLISKIYEHDSTNTFKHFKELEGDIYSAEVHHIRHNAIILLDDEGNELVLPKSEQIRSDYFRKGDSVRGIIKTVELRGNKPVIIMSRTAPEFLEKLFEQEIPEVFDGLITIEGVARIPGEKAKVAVDSYDDRIDPVGACVGMKGSRIHGIVRELGNENIDVLNYTKNTQLFIARALSPAKVVSMKIHEEEGREDGKKGRVDVFLLPEEVSKAIGKNGVNIRLASQLTGFELDVQREGVEMEDDVELTEFSDEIEAWVIQEFKNIGLDTARSVLEKDVTELVKRTDLEEETILEVQKILREEFED
ncbi:transcription termination factor NusA [Lutibacter holmesii]|uniref:Transcription termination/antitermination protein NusA n=1 Tax=Lutibacter holmesii TaxID=1137985 RepID=A0ABW3WMZ6_9FLAO